MGHALKMIFEGPFPLGILRESEYVKDVKHKFLPETSCWKGQQAPKQEDRAYTSPDQRGPELFHIEEQRVPQLH